jgi:hypothetical protein
MHVVKRAPPGGSQRAAVGALRVVSEPWLRIRCSACDVHKEETGPSGLTDPVSPWGTPSRCYWSTERHDQFTTAVKYLRPPVTGGLPPPPANCEWIKAAEDPAPTLVWRLSESLSRQAAVLFALGIISAPMRHAQSPQVCARHRWLYVRSLCSPTWPVAL